MYKHYRELLLIIILSLIFVGVAKDVKQSIDERKIHEIYISTPKGNFKFDNDREFKKFMEGYE